MLFRSNSRVTSFLARSLVCRKTPTPESEHPSEQDCFRDLIYHNEHGEKERALFIPQWKMNAFPEEIPCYDQSDPRKWERGMFVVHFAGAWAHMPNTTEDPKGTLFRKYQWLIVGDEDRKDD
jgi:mannan polymerase II complex MNN10 subunit